ncbi:MAG: Calx-beta domain-containing protein [Verrucomicrobiota bacterium]
MPCCLKVEVEPANATPGQLVRLHATVADRDDNSFAYAWSFDDGTFSTNNSSWTYKTWSQPGEHVVRCEVSDMRGGRASANVVVTVGAASDFRVTGLVLDENGNPLEDVFVDPSYTNSNGPVTGFTDSYGVFVLTGLAGQINFNPAKYGYRFEPSGWANPLTISSNTTGLNFIARALTNVTLTLTTNLLFENIATSGQLILARSGSVSNDLNVQVFLTGTAGIPGDLTFTPPLTSGSNNVVIPAGTNRVVFAFAPANNGTVEPTETLNITVRETDDYVLTTLAEQRITILDDDQPAIPAVTIATLDGPVLENGMNPAGFVIARTGSTAGDLPVTYAVSGSATATTDYATLLGTVIIPAGSASATVALQVRDDKEVEPNETVVLTINPSPTYTITTTAATATIIDDDLLVVTVSPTGSGLAEPGSSGRFTVQRDGDLTTALVVYYTLAGSASNGVDYTSPSGFVTIPAGATAADVIIGALNDALVEGDETVTLVLSTNAAYDIGTPGSATLILRDDERVTVTVSATDNSASEPGSDFGTFTITRTGSASGNLTVNVAVNGTAIAGADYVPLENPVVIPDGNSSVTLTVIPFEDLFWEPTETVNLTLIASTNYNLGSSAHATVEIQDNDTSTPAVGFTFATMAALESESPGLPVALSHTSTVPIMVQYQVIGGTATAGADYSLPAGTLEFAPGEWAKSIPLPITDDTQVETDETIRVTLFNPTSAAHDGIQIMTYTIRDNDASAVSVTATAATASEVGPVAGNFRISRTGGTNNSQLVNFQITGTASTPSDCPALGTSITIPAGATFVDLPITPVNDGTVELDEDLTLTLISAPTGRIVAPSTATITILDANTNNLPTVVLTATNQPYAVEGGANGSFVLTRTGATTDPLTVYLSTSGTATSGADYTALPNSVTFAIGQNTLPLAITATDDTAVEGEETIIVALTARDTYRVAYPGTVTMTIQDNDQSVWINASDFDAAEPGLDRGEFVFTRFGTTNTPVQVFFTISGTAGNGSDYVSISNSFTIPAGSLTASLPITPLNDALFENREQVTLTLQTNAAYTIATPNTATVLIRDDEPTVSLTANVTEIAEASPVPAVLTVRREGDPNREFTVNLAVGGTATAGVDYPAFSTNIFFSCGIVAVDLLVFPTNEAVAEAEFLTATLLPSPSYTRSAQSNVNLTIVDAGLNHEPRVTITSPTTNLVFLLQTNANMILEATVTDTDGDTNTLGWSKVSGPDTMSFSATDTNNTTVSFTNSGVYVLRLAAGDAAMTNYAEVTVVVGAMQGLTNNPAGEELLHWKFDEGSGPMVFDVSGHQRNGTIQGALGWVTNGISGGALNLSGTNNFVAAGNDTGFLNGLSRFTLSCWIKPAAVPATRGLFAADDSGAPTLTLATRQFASCGPATNVIESTLVTSCGEARQISASNAVTNGWQHLALTWTNGFDPLLYLNGKLDQSGRHKVPLLGELVNCPKFLLGKGPTDIAATWAGQMDELQVFSWQLSAAEVGAFVAGNFGPIVEVATNLTVPVVTPVEITGTVTDDGRPIPPGTVTLTWSQLSGSLPVTLTNVHALTNTVLFTQSGDYVFRLIADDGQVKIFADLPVTVVEPTLVNVSASDPAATELGPDPGEFTFNRVGDLSFALTLFITQTGTASNGTDFVQIPLTNSITFPVDIDTLKITLTPFLDHRTEGDETFTLTIVSNVLYTIGSGVATVTIQDSPYGMWNIANFTLEELTDPLLSGETADYDADGLINFAEYAANRIPKSPETNAPVLAVIEPNPNDNLNHVTFTYQRRLPPTDVAYAAAFSTNLLTWRTDTNAVREISATPDTNGVTETVKAQVVAPWPATSPQFITVKVWLLSTGP